MGKAHVLTLQFIDIAPTHGVLMCVYVLVCVHVCVYIYTYIYVLYTSKNLPVIHQIPSSQKGELSIPCLKLVIILSTLSKILQIAPYA